MLPSTRQLETSVISHAPKEAIGPLFVDIVRGPILPPRGTKERDWQLRIWDQADFNSMWQGARSGLVKKIAHIPFEIKGPPSKVQYWQDFFGYAHFGRGYEYLVENWGRDYLTQSYGGIFEISGYGDPAGPLIGDPVSVNHLDAGRCYVTGNTTYPILYYSLWDGKLHRMHASRVYQIVDDPIPDERYFGLGTSALERAISINQREVRMNQYVDARLDDMPQPGLLSVSGASRSQWDAWVTQYKRDTSSDGLGPFGRTIVVTSVDPNAGVKVESTSFAQTPDKFDLVAYKSLDVDEICLAIGIDRQEIWELAGRGLGSGSQSQVMAEKAKGKTTGTMIAALERFVNWVVFKNDNDCEFEIKTKDESEQSSTATLNLQYAQTAAALVTAGFTKQEIAKVLVEGSQTYKDAFTDDKGNLIVTSEVQAPDPTTLTLAPAPVAPAAPGAKPTGQVTGQSDTPLAAKPRQGSPAPQLAGKEFASYEQQQGFFGTHPEFSSSARTSDSGDWPAKAPRVPRGIISEGEPLSSRSNVSPEKTPRQHAADILRSQGGKTYQRVDAKDSSVYDKYDMNVWKHPNGKDARLYVSGVSTRDRGRETKSDLGYFNLSDNSFVGSNSDRGFNEKYARHALNSRNSSAAKAFSITRIDFESNFSRILGRAVKGGARPNQIENLMLGLLQSSGLKAFQDGLREGGVNDAPDDSDLQEIQNIISDSIDYLDPLLQSAFNGDIAPDQVKIRAFMWSNKTLSQFHDAGRVSADKNAMYEWFLGPTAEHCDGSHGGVPCPRLAGQVHRFRDWYSRDLLPNSDRLDCKGFNCQCKLMRTSNPAQGRF